MKRKLLPVLVVFVLLMFSHPALATSAEMNFHATCIPDTLHPGELTKITVLIDNDAKASGFLINASNAKSSADLLKMITTAYNVRANMSGDLPFTVENAHYQLVGTIPQGMPGKAIFIVKVPDNAKPGSYSVPINLKYTQVVANPVISGGTITGFTLTYLDQVDTVYVKISIVKKDFDVSLKTNSELFAGSEGTIRLAVTNTGRYAMDNVTVVANVTPPFMPNAGSSTAFLGRINPGETKYASIKLFVSSSALNQTYPLTFRVIFTTPGGKPVMFPKQIGVRVISKDVFNVKVVNSRVSRFIALPPTAAQGMSSGQLPLQSSSQSMMSPMASKPATMPTTMPMAQPTSLATTPAASPTSTASSNQFPSIGYAVIEVKDLGVYARDVTVNLMFTNPLLTAMTNPYIGTLKPGESKDAIVYIRSLAPAGTYKAYVILSYKNAAGDSVVSKKYPVAISVEAPPFKVVKVETKNLYVGNVGEVDITISGNVSNANFYLISPDPSMKPVSLTSYAFNSTSTLKFRVYVSPQSTDGYHCMYLVGRYDEGGATNLVSTLKVPVFVEPKTVLFRVVKVESIGLYPDETGTVKVTVVNAGRTPVYNAVVELSISPPLSIAGESAIGSMIGVSTPGTYFVGTLKPGQSATASFRIKVDKHAGAGNYPANVRIMYYDSNGYQHLSNSITVSVEVKNKPLLTPLTASALIFTIIGLIVAARYARSKRKKKQD